MVVFLHGFRRGSRRVDARGTNPTWLAATTGQEDNGCYQPKSLHRELLVKITTRDLRELKQLRCHSGRQAFCGFRGQYRRTPCESTRHTWTFERCPDERCRTVANH